MKVIYKIAVLMGLSFTVSNLQAQIIDDVSAIKLYENEEDKTRLTIGGRFMADVAYYGTDYTVMNSGASITDARLRSSFTYQQWLFYADFDFVKGKVAQKNIFLKYDLTKGEEGNHSLKLGYYNEPSTMALNTSKYNLHFFTRASSALALSAKRALGLSYKYYDNSFFFDQGVFSENLYNDQKAGNQGFSLSGRWLYNPFTSTDKLDGHIGFSARYATINTGVQENNILKTHIVYSSPLETEVNSTKKFLKAELPWAKNTLDLGVEALFHTQKYFVRGEYLYNKVYKERPDEVLFTNQLGGLWSWTTLESWQKGNPIDASQFSGFYIELGHLLKGDSYSYNKEHGVLNGSNKDGDLEVVARYSLTNLNDIKDGEFFLIGKETFYSGGAVADYPSKSTSIGGGKLQTAVLGLNYTFNMHVKGMLAYQYSNLDNVYFPNDKNFHLLQTRVMFSF